MSSRIITPRIVPDPAARRGRPLRLLLMLSAALLCGAALGYFAAAARVDPIGASSGNQGRLLQEARRDIDRLAQELAIARRGSQITEQASGTLRAQILGLESEIAELKADVAFYQRLLGTGGKQKGLVVHELRLVPTSSDRVYRYQLTLSQHLNKAKIVSGQYQLAAEGVQDGQMVQLTSEALKLRPQDERPAFEFKYFQQVEGSLQLPEGFAPEALLVQLEVPTRKKTVERRFEWASLMGGNNEIAKEEALDVQSEG